MQRFFAGAHALIIGKLERAWNALSVATIPMAALPGAEHTPGWRPDDAWREVADALVSTKAVLEEHKILSTETMRQVDRALNSAQYRNAHYSIGVIQELGARICDELRTRVYFVIDEDQTEHITKPLKRFGDAAAKFPAAVASMEAASRCYALDQWDATVFHSMRVLEHGLRWLAAQINAGPFPLTLKKPVELENWENIIGNIESRIRQELAASIPRTPARDEELAFYGSIGPEFRYFKDAWRNHIMHDRNDPHDAGTSQSVLDHVASFMRILAERV